MFTYVPGKESSKGSLPLSYLNLSKKKVQGELDKQAIEQLGFKPIDSISGCYFIPETTKCTVKPSEKQKLTGKISSKAFVIEEFCLLDYSVMKESIQDLYEAVRSNGVSSVKGGLLDNSVYVKLKKEHESISVEELVKKMSSPVGERFSFIGKLKYPYVLFLDSQL